MGVNPTSIAELHFPEVIIDVALFIFINRLQYVLQGLVNSVRCPLNRGFKQKKLAKYNLC